jgi:hypothetical protein
MPLYPSHLALALYIPSLLAVSIIEREAASIFVWTGQAVFKLTPLLKNSPLDGDNLN